MEKRSFLLSSLRNNQNVFLFAPQPNPMRDIMAFELSMLNVVSSSQAFILKFVRNSTFDNRLKMYDHLEQKYLIDYGADSDNFKMRFKAALGVNQSVSETLKFRQISSVYIY